MSRFLINGLKLKTGGGKSIIRDYLAQLALVNSSDVFYVLVPNVNDYIQFGSPHIVFVDVPSYAKNNFLFIFLYYVEFPRIIRFYKIDAILNFGDIIIPTKVPQVYFFDWAYAVYPETPVWKMMSIKEWGVRNIKAYLIERLAKVPEITIAQTRTIESRLVHNLGFKNVKVIPNAVSNDLLENEKKVYFPKSEYVDFLCLSYYYVHKNLEILIDVARLISENRKKIRIYITIDESQGDGAAQLLATIRKENLEGVLCNMGPIAAKDLQITYKKFDFFLMPSILESYGLTYIEAMANGLTTLVADLDFAQEVCGSAAYFFNPFDPQSIYDVMQGAISDESGRFEKREKGYDLVADLPDWSTNFARYQQVLKSIAK